MQDIQLSKHFKLSEFTRSSTATKYGIDNTPPLEVISNLQYLCQELLEPLREWMNEPIIISSGYRCPKLNSHPEVRGAAKSQHLTGEAADLHIPIINAPNGSLIQDMATARKWIEWILENRFDQLILEHTIPKPSSINPHLSPHYWIHVSLKRTNNRQTYTPKLLKR